MSKFNQIVNEAIDGFLYQESNEMLIRNMGYNVLNGKSPKTVADFMRLIYDSFDKRGECYTPDGKWYFSLSYDNSLKISDISEALFHGKQVESWTISTHKGKTHLDDIIAHCLPQDMKFQTFLDLIKSEKLDEHLIDNDRGLDISDTEFYFNNYKEKAVGVYSPFNVDKLKRLTKMPAKLKKMDVVKLLVNGQYKGLKRDFKYTDDYAFDSAINFGKKENLPFKLVLNIVDKMIKDRNGRQRMIEPKKGVYVVDFSPHSNESWSFLVDLNGKMRLKG
jgi:hypothetical protein